MAPGYTSLSYTLLGYINRLCSKEKKLFPKYINRSQTNDEKSSFVTLSNRKFKLFVHTFMNNTLLSYTLFVDLTT